MVGLFKLFPVIEEKQTKNEISSLRFEKILILAKSWRGQKTSGGRKYEKRAAFSLGREVNFDGENFENLKLWKCKGAGKSGGGRKRKKKEKAWKASRRNLESCGTKKKKRTKELNSKQAGRAGRQSRQCRQFRAGSSVQADSFYQRGVIARCQSCNYKMGASFSMLCTSRLASRSIRCSYPYSCLRICCGPPLAGSSLRSPSIWSAHVEKMTYACTLHTSGFLRHT